MIGLAGLKVSLSKRVEKGITIVLPRSNDHVYICLFINIEIQTSGLHIQQSGVVLKTIQYQPDSSVGKVVGIRKSIYLPSIWAGSIPTHALFYATSFLLYHIFTCIV